MIKEVARLPTVPGATGDFPEPPKVTIQSFI
jgi:hypothetical protein